MKNAKTRAKKYTWENLHLLPGAFLCGICLGFARTSFASCTGQPRKSCAVRISGLFGGPHHSRPQSPRFTASAGLESTEKPDMCRREELWGREWGHTSCKHGGLYEWVGVLFKIYYNWYISIIVLKYLHFTWRVARQTHRLYVLRMIVKLAHYPLSL